MPRGKLSSKDLKFQQQQSELAQAKKDFYRKLREQYQRLGSEQFRTLHGVRGSSRRASSHVNKAYQRYMRELKGNPQKRLNQLEHLHQRIQSSLTLHFESHDHDDASIEAHTQQSCDSNNQTLTSLPQRIFERELNTTLSPYEFRIINDSSNQQPNQTANGTVLSREVNYAQVCQQLMGVFLMLNNLPEELQTNITQATNATLDDIAEQIQQIGQSHHDEGDDAKNTVMLVFALILAGLMGLVIVMGVGLCLAKLFERDPDRYDNLNGDYPSLYRGERENERRLLDEQALLGEQGVYARNDAHRANLERTSVSCFITKIRQIKEVVTNADVQWNLDIIQKFSTKNLQTFLERLTHNQLLAVAQLPPRYFRLNVLQAIEQYANTHSQDLSAVTQKLNLYEQLNGKLENIVLPESQIEAQTEQVQLHQLSKLLDDYLQNDVADKRFKALLKDNFELIGSEAVIKFDNSPAYIHLDPHNLTEIKKEQLNEFVVMQSNNCVALVKKQDLNNLTRHPLTMQRDWRNLYFDNDFDIQLLNVLVSLQAEAYKNPGIRLTSDAFEYIVNLRELPQVDLNTIGHELDSPFHDQQQLACFIEQMQPAQMSRQQCQQLCDELANDCQLPDNSFELWLLAKQDKSNEGNNRSALHGSMSLFRTYSWRDLRNRLEGLFEQRLSRFTSKPYSQLANNNASAEQDRTATTSCPYTQHSGAAYWRHYSAASAASSTQQLYDQGYGGLAAPSLLND